MDGGQKHHLPGPLAANLRVGSVKEDPTPSQEREWQEQGLKVWVWTVEGPPLSALGSRVNAQMRSPPGGQRKSETEAGRAGWVPRVSGCE